MPQADSKSPSVQEQQQTVQTVPYPQNFEDDTIDLYELWNSLWNWKWLVIALTVVVTIGSVIYSLVATSIYKAEALLLPPNAKDIQSMNFSGISMLVKEYEQDTSSSNDVLKVFSKFKQNLNSRTIHKKFIQKKGLMELLAPDRTAETKDDEIYQGFAQLIKLSGKGRSGNLNEITSLSIKMYDAEIAAQLVNDLIEFVDKETITMLVEDSQNAIANKIRDVEYTIASKRLMAKMRREDQINRYNEAAIVAEALGIKRRVEATNIIQNTQMNVDISTVATPLYYLGFEALMTQISILKDRKSDDPFISGLRDLQEQLELLRSIKFDKENMSAVQIDQAAYPPKYAIEPNRRRIVSLATVVGLFSGILLVFFIEFVKNQRKKHSG